MTLRMRAQTNCVWLLDAGLCVSAVPLAVAQRPPSDNELKAAYCIPYIQDSIRVLQHFAKGGSGELSPVEIDAISTLPIGRELSENKDRLSRLQSYLIPKLQYLDALAIGAASARAAADIQGAKDQTAACTKSDRVKSCMETFYKSELWARINGCRDLVWLPF